MGTASLVIGIACIISGFYVIFIWGEGEVLTEEEEELAYSLYSLMIGVPLIVVGGLILRKFDRDRKKEKRG